MYILRTFVYPFRFLLREGTRFRAGIQTQDLPYGMHSFLNFEEFAPTMSTVLVLKVRTISHFYRLKDRITKAFVPAEKSAMVHCYHALSKLQRFPHTSEKGGTFPHML